MSLTFARLSCLHSGLELKACLVMGVAFILLLIAWFVVATVAKQTGASWIDRFYGSISRLLA